MKDFDRLLARAEATEDPVILADAIRVLWEADPGDPRWVRVRQAVEKSSAFLSNRGFTRELARQGQPVHRRAS